MKNPFINTASALATVIALATTANAQQGSTQVITDIESSPKSVAEANAAAAAAAQAQANNNNLVVVCFLVFFYRLHFSNINSFCNQTTIIQNISSRQNVIFQSPCNSR